jgi:class 3 adenylate cyclase
MSSARVDATGEARSSLLDAAVAYVPRVLLESIARNPDRPSPWQERIEGTLLMGDVSGFTALSELLAEAGKEGAEWLTGIIDSFFGSMLGIASRFGGDTMIFGGDALLSRGDDAAAESLLRTSVGQAGQIGDPYEPGLSLLALAEVYATATDPAVGRGTFRRRLRQATCALSSVGARAALERARELEARIQSAPSPQ